MERTYFALGGLLAAIAVALGAFGAHALRDRLTTDLLATFETGVRYQMYHALALFAVAWALSRYPASTPILASGWLFLAGIILFSGSLYLLVLTDLRILGAVTPLGGVAFILGWLSLTFGVWQG